MKIRNAIAGILATAALVAGAGQAAAVSTDEYDNVRYWFCGDGLATLDYTNKYGNFQQETYYMDKCAYYDFTERDEYGGYASASITDSNGGPVSCTIYVNGTVVSKSNDDSEYFSYASCY